MHLHKKILLSNLGYSTGLDGSYFDYIFKFYKYALNSKNNQKIYLEKFNYSIKKEKPDLILINEIKLNFQVDFLKNLGYKLYEFENKYGEKSILRKFPFFKNNGNGFISKEKINFEKIYLKNGTKKLIYRIIFDDINIYLGHFSLNKKTREKQFLELSKIIKKSEKNIICGDFNIFGGAKELKSICNNLDLKNSGENKSFPSYKPKHNLDIFLFSKNIYGEEKIINNIFSDHLAKVLEIKTNIIKIGHIN